MCIRDRGSFDRVYTLFQEKCITCHNHAANFVIDLEGAGATLFEKKQSVYNNIVNKTPITDHAKQAGNKIIYPGRPDKSFLFRKINQNLDPEMHLVMPEEGQSMPPYGSPQLDDVQKETIRQWIIYGANRVGQLFDPALLDSFYSGNAIKSFPSGAPEKPDISEGFQIKMGPFFIEPAGEVEYYQKYKLDLPIDVEVDRIDVFMGNFSHHFLIYDFDSDPGAGIPDGLRKNSNHQNVSLTMAFQSSASLQLPNKTAFFWDKNIVLDLNSHYINYSGSFVYQAEVYINVYFKERGNALHEMKTTLIPKVDIVIPNNGQTIKFEQAVVLPFFGEIFVWAMAGHTHKYGRSSKVYLRNANGTKGQLIYDGSCPEGIPGCEVPYFNYQHIPFSIFKPLQAINMSRGFIHEATYMNDGPETVRWGPTSDDEMMLVVLSYVQDTSGITTPLIMTPMETSAITISPNPAQKEILVEWPSSFKDPIIQLTDLTGKIVLNTKALQGSSGSQLELPPLPEGIYILLVIDKISGLVDAKKLYIQSGGQ
jgi:hypothetical protein